jgi:glucose/arabinose dehydrogenase
MGSAFRGALVVVAFFLLAAGPATATPPGNFSEHTVASGLTAPTAVEFLPDGGLLVAEKAGALKLVRDGAVTTLTTIPVCTASEMGLLGIALHPDFRSNGIVFLYRTKSAPTGCATATGRFNQVVTVRLAGDTVVAGSLTERLSGIRTDNGNHDGGALRIGPDRKLYVAVGDTGRGDGGGPGQSTNPYSQDRGALEGKILRLELDGVTPAAGNPFTGVAGARPEVYAFGFRNPWRMGFDPRTGRLWVGDVGQGALEEIDIVQAGGNYAWPHCEGTLPAGCQAGATPGPVIDPVFAYPHSGPGALGTTVTGGAFPNTTFGPHTGSYFFADSGAHKIYVATPNAARDDIGTPVDFITNAGYPVDLAFGLDGALYYVAYAAGEVRRVVTTYPRPASAVKAHVALTPAYQACTSPNRRHGPPLDAGSCAPPALASGVVTIGASASGFVTLRVLPGDPGTPADEADVSARLYLDDVRRRSDGADYTGELRVRVATRITDKDNPPPAGAGGLPDGTVADGSLEFDAPCSASPAAGTGATCSTTTSVDAIAPGAVNEGNRSIWQLGRVEVYDGGPDGVGGTTPNTLFATQGAFIP